MEKHPKQGYKNEPEPQVVIVIYWDFVAVLTGFDEVFTKEEQSQPTDCSRKPIGQYVQCNSSSTVHRLLEITQTQIIKEYFPTCD